MIPKIFIQEWREHAPWLQDRQVEQDLIISRVLIELFSHPKLSKKIAFRGGTALYKLFIKPPPRYSEDIDLVQIQAEPIGEIFSLIKQIIEPLLGQPKWKLNEGRATLFYKYLPEGIEGATARLKIEINTREHFSVYDLLPKTMSIGSRWFSGSADIISYNFNELIGTKLRAFYQRKKGRDLFDLWMALEHKNFNANEVVNTFNHYMRNEGNPVTRAMFEINLAEKLMSNTFIQDIQPLLAPNIQWDIQTAANAVRENFIALLPGEAWKSKLFNEDS